MKVKAYKTGGGIMYDMDACKYLSEIKDISYENDSLGSYLAIKVDAEQKISWYQVEMISNNPCGGILPCVVRRKDNIVLFYYNITSKLSLSKFLKRKALKKYELVCLVAGITNVIMLSKSLLLSDKSFLISCDYIFVNPATLEISLVYLPIKCMHDINIKVKELVKEIVINIAEIEDGQGEDFVIQILNYLKVEGFNIKGFNS